MTYSEIVQSLWDHLSLLTSFSPFTQHPHHFTKDAFYYCTGIHYPFLNGIIEKTLDRPITPTDIETALSFFQTLPFVWWTEDTALLSSHFCFAGHLKAIATPITPNLSSTPSPFVIKRVSLMEEVDQFSAINGEVFGLTALAQEEMTLVNRALATSPRAYYLVAYLHQEPVATLFLSFSQNSGGLWNFATLPAYRGQGAGTALVHAAFRYAKAANCTQLVAFLAPDSMAGNIFQQSGFQTIHSFPVYSRCT